MTLDVVLSKCPFESENANFEDWFEENCPAGSDDGACSLGLCSACPVKANATRTGEGLVGVVCKKFGKKLYVTEIKLGQTRPSLTGQIPHSIGKLSHLDELDLSLNELSGKIPPSIGNLTNLHSLNLQSNLLTGDIPKTFKELLNIEFIWLDNNLISGALNPDMLDGGWRYLKTLDLRGNRLSGVLPPKITQLRHLSTLYLGGTKGSNYNLFCPVLDYSMVLNNDYDWFEPNQENPEGKHCLPKPPTNAPSTKPINPPTRPPVPKPTRPPSRKPLTARPTVPTRKPTPKTPPTKPPTKPTASPTAPTQAPTKTPAPTRRPTLPTPWPTMPTTSRKPTRRPTRKPTLRPTRIVTSNPTPLPTEHPTKPTRAPGHHPTPPIPPTKKPTEPTPKPTKKPRPMPPTEPPHTPAPIGPPVPSTAPTHTIHSVPTKKPSPSHTPAPTQNPNEPSTDDSSILFIALGGGGGAFLAGIGLFCIMCTGKGKNGRLWKRKPEETPRRPTMRHTIHSTSPSARKPTLAPGAAMRFSQDWSGAGIQPVPEHHFTTGLRSSFNSKSMEREPRARTDSHAGGVHPSTQSYHRMGGGSASTAPRRFNGPNGMDNRFGGGYGRKGSRHSSNRSSKGSKGSNSSRGSNSGSDQGSYEPPSPLNSPVHEDSGWSPEMVHGSDADEAPEAAEREARSGSWVGTQVTHRHNTGTSASSLNTGKSDVAADQDPGHWEDVFIDNGGNHYVCD